MKDAPDFESQRHLVIYNDDETPYGFVTQLLVDVLAKSEEDANAIAREISSNGSKAIGQLPGNVAESARDRRLSLCHRINNYGRMDRETLLYKVLAAS